VQASVCQRKQSTFGNRQINLLLIEEELV
jgi:hypothetical protein